MPNSLNNFAELIAVMKKLRAPDGCPWDRKQTIRSLRPYIIEEAYELVDAIESVPDSKKPTRILEECGDLLLQVLFIGIIAEENSQFNVSDIPKTISEKLVRRHPHVFGGKQISTSEEAYADWETIKRREREDQKTDTSVLAGVPRNMPAVTKAFRIQEKAASVGFDWPKDDQDPVVEKIKEELNEVCEELPNPGSSELAAEIGDLLFAAINLARRSGIDPDAALSLTNAKFERRFRFVEKRSEEIGKKCSEIPLEALESFWNQAKELGM